MQYSWCCWESARNHWMCQELRDENGLGKDVFLLNIHTIEFLGTTSRSLLCGVVVTAFQAIFKQIWSYYSHILLCSTVAVWSQFVDRDSDISIHVVVSRQPKIGQFDVSIRSEKHIFRLQIPLCVESWDRSYVDDSHTMQMLQRQDDLCDIQPCSIFGEDPKVREVCKQISALHVVHHHIETIRSLIGVV